MTIPSKMHPVTLKNHRDWIQHYADMIRDIDLELQLRECDTPPADTAALKRVLKMLKANKAHHEQSIRGEVMKKERRS